MEPDWNGPQVTMIWGNPYNLGTPIEYVNMFHQPPRWTMKITTMKITNINHHSPPWSTMIRDLNNIPMLSIISLKSSSGSFRQVRQAEFRRRFRPGNKKREVETATFSTGGWTLKIRVVSTLWMSTELAIEWEINDQKMAYHPIWRNLEHSKVSPKWSSSLLGPDISGFSPILTPMTWALLWVTLWLLG